MPTARELLEQADALMRRNRAASEGPRPDPQPGGGVSWSAPLPGSTSPRTIQREPIPPSTARTSLPFDPTESPVFTIGEPASRGPATAQHAPPPDDDVPVLTQPVETAADDDVPLLTDVVEEIDVGIVDEGARGEPSIWDLATRGEASVLGRGPDSVSVLPAAAPAELPLTPPAGRDPLGLDQPAPGFDASPVADDAPAPPAEVATADETPDALPELRAAARFVRAGGELALVTPAEALARVLDGAAFDASDDDVLRIRHTVARRRSAAPVLAAGLR